MRTHLGLLAGLAALHNAPKRVNQTGPGVRTYAGALAGFTPIPSPLTQKCQRPPAGTPKAELRRQHVNKMKWKYRRGN